MVRWTGITILIVLFLFGNYNFIDLNEAVDYYGSFLLPSNPLLGSIIFVAVLSIVLFTNELKKLIDYITNQFKLKENFG